MNSSMVEFVAVGKSHTGQVLSMECNPQTKFSEVHEFLRLKLGDNLFRVYLEHHGPKEIDGILLSCLQDFLCITNPIPLMIINPKEEIQVYVKTLTGKVFTCYQPLNYPMEHLKIQIQEKEGIQPCGQRLVFGGKQLEDSKTAKDYGIKNGDTIHLVLRLRGGGFSFVDVSKSDAQVNVDWSPDAPEWRKAAPGISLEAKCMNDNCKAYKQYVICSHGCARFNFEDLKVICPMCRNPAADIDNIGFSNCFYKIRGMKSGSNTEFCTAWTKVDDCYRTWDKEKAGISEWSYLEIITCELSRSKHPVHKVTIEAPLASECAICFCAIYTEKEATMLECTHSYHASCWEQWEVTLYFQNMTRTCPLCRAPIMS